MTRWTAAELPDLSGKTIVITGASSGIGLIDAREFARAGAHVVIAVRNVAKGREVGKGIVGDVEVRGLDVSDLSSVREFAETWTEHVDVLVNNAGIMGVPLSRTRDGLELVTATNSFGPHLLTSLLLPKITDRVVWVASQLHRVGRLRLDDLNWTARPYRPLNAYADSKLQVVLQSLELQRKLSAAGSSVRSVIAHPGIATTTLVADSSMNVINRLSFLLNDPEHGALPTLFAATQNVSGNSYVGPDGLAGVKGNPVARKPGKKGLDRRAATALWDAIGSAVGLSAGERNLTSPGTRPGGSGGPEVEYRWR